MSDRLTRKEMKRRDSFQIFMSTALEYVQRHRRQLIAGVVILVLVVVAVVAWGFWAASREDRAQVALAEAIEVYGAPVEADASEDDPDGDGPTFASDEARRERARELFTRVHDEYGWSDAAAIAEVYLGKLAVASGDTARARELWQEFLDDQDDHALAAEIRLNVLKLDRAEGRAEQVATELEGMLARQRKPLPGDVILHELAVTLEQLGREEEAVERYRQLLEEYQGSPYSAVARQKTSGGGRPAMQMPANFPS